jgi:shikimate dehydrogenase
VGHSLSPALHNAAFEALGLDMVYVALPVAAGRVGAAVRGLQALGFRGASVTVPHKAAVVPFLDEVQGDAALIGAVNTIVVEPHGLIGHNTDAPGTHQALVQTCGDSLQGRPALLLGAGGAARAVALTLARLAMPLTVVNRSPAAAEELAALVRAAVPGAACRTAAWGDLDAELVAAQRLIVNATTLGMTAASKVPAVVADNVSAGQVVFDVVYTSGTTDLLVRARQRGATVVDGVDLLVWQAAAAFELWTGRPAPLEVMRHAATQQA